MIQDIKIKQNSEIASVCKTKLQKTSKDNSVFDSQEKDGNGKDESQINWKKVLLIGGAALIGIMAARAIGKKLLNNYFKKNAWRFRSASMPELSEATRLENFSKIKALEGLSDKQKLNLLNEIKGFDDGIFLATLTGHKPAYLHWGRDLSSITTSKSFSEGFDLIQLSRPSDPKNHFLHYILNRQKTMEVIERNKDIFAHRMGLEQSSTVESIYSELLKHKDKYLESAYHAKTTDLVGLILGYPRKSSMIFNLEGGITGDVVSLRGTKQYRKLLLERLLAQDSPYRGLPEKVLEDLKIAIKSSAPAKDTKTGGLFYFAKLANEPEEICRLRDATKAFKREFSINRLIA